MRTRCVLMLAGWLATMSLPAWAGNDWTKVATALGKSGAEMPGGVYRVGLPRTDLKITSMAWSLSQHWRSEVRLDDGKFGKFSVRLDFGTSLHSSQTCPRRSGLANNHEQTQSCLQSAFIWRMSV